jgi:hypothetical protein
MQPAARHHHRIVVLLGEDEISLRLEKTMGAALREIRARRTRPEPLTPRYLATKFAA